MFLLLENGSDLFFHPTLCHVIVTRELSSGSAFEKRTERSSSARSSCPSGRSHLPSKPRNRPHVPLPTVPSITRPRRDRHRPPPPPPPLLPNAPCKTLDPQNASPRPHVGAHVGAHTFSDYRSPHRGHGISDPSRRRGELRVSRLRNSSTTRWSARDFQLREARSTRLCRSTTSWMRRRGTKCRSGRLTSTSVLFPSLD